jgi:hypothetical protein
MTTGRPTSASSRVGPAPESNVKSGGAFANATVASPVEGSRWRRAPAELGQAAVSAISSTAAAERAGRTERDERTELEQLFFIRTLQRQR